MRILTIGDPHVTISNLEDSRRLLNFIYKVAETNKVDLIEFTGDLFHNHSVLRQEVIQFWKMKLKHLSTLNIPIIIIAGNHDFTSNKAHEGEFSAISNLEGVKNVVIVNDMLVFNSPVGKLGYLAYTSNHDKFVLDAKEMYEQGVNRLLAHQTFAGVQYSNGFYAPDAIDPNLIPQEHLISGHIHTSGKIGKCFYVGAPKADNMADANIGKYIWLSDYDGNAIQYTPVSTDGVVTTYKKFVVKEGEDLPEMSPENKNYLELVGSNKWILTTKKQLKNTQNLQIKAVPTDARVQTEAKNLVNIKDFLISSFKPQHGISLNDVSKYLEKLDE